MVAPPATQADRMTPVKKPSRAPLSLTQGSSMPMVKTPMMGPFVTPPMVMASSSMPGMNLTR